MAASSHVALRKVTLQAARSKEFPEGSIRHGYDFIAPLTDEGRIDLQAWKAHRGECFAHRHWGDEPTMQGLLVHRAGGPGGSTWTFEWKGVKEEIQPTRTRATASATISSRSANMSRCGSPKARC